MRRIAKGLGCTPAEILPTVDNPWALSDDEKSLLARYRQSKEEDQEKLLRVADVVLEFRGADKDAA
jgi:hypothetical protein